MSKWIVIVGLTSVKFFAFLVMFETFCVCIVDLEIHPAVGIVVAIVK